jgi:uncharacterized membrane protein
LRGIVIVLMVLDHVRYFLSDSRFDPTDPDRTTTALFFTRWITHFCAPTFMLLAGVGAHLSLSRGRNRSTLARFLLTRGLWLVLLELTVARLGWMFNFDYHYSSALVLWALGWCMVALAALVWLPRPAGVALSLCLIVGHNLLDRVTPGSWGGWSWVWTILHVPGPIPLGHGYLFDVWYPLVPWIGVMAGGYLIGPLFDRPAEVRNRILLRTGLAMSVAFVALRWLNAYGDPAPWSQHAGLHRTAFAFLATTKYPPWLQFLLMTLGPTLAVLPRLDRACGRLAAMIRTIGRVPLFFWLLHVPLIHAVAVGLSLSRHGAVAPWLIQNPPVDPPAGYGYPLIVVYGIAVGVVAALYPACRWFGGLKQRRRDVWLTISERGRRRPE